MQPPRSGRVRSRPESTDTRIAEITARQRGYRTKSLSVAIVYHSGYGHTERLAKAVATDAASIDGVEVVSLDVEAAAKAWDTLEQADAMIFGAPTYVAGASAALKAFQEASSTALATSSRATRRSGSTRL
ncbi:flavodoxin family protein [Rhizobium sp. BT-226]|uniref:flavodoxin family protein n=1 Tax=Rhizobium sp. BT-226 TaxID=2986922 RepID=UPI0035575F5F